MFDRKRTSSSRLSTVTVGVSVILPCDTIAKVPQRTTVVHEKNACAGNYGREVRCDSEGFNKHGMKKKSLHTSASDKSVKLKLN